MTTTPKMDDLDNLFDGPEETRYFILGLRPVKITYSNEMIIQAETPDKDGKTFISDISVVNRISNSMDVKEVSRNDFCNYCQSLGIFKF